MIASERLFAVIDAHDAAHEVYDLDAGESQFLHFRGDTLLRGVVQQRFQDVAMRVRIAAKYATQYRHEPPEIGEVNSAPNSVVRLAKVQAEKAAAGPRDALHLAQAELPVRQVAEAIADGDDIEAVVGKRNLLRVPAYKLNARARRPDFVPGIVDGKH